MSFWQTWLRRPRTVFLRKVSFQIHLWLGLALGLYVVVLSLTGSAIVFRRELDAAFGPARQDAAGLVAGGAHGVRTACLSRFRR